MNNRIILLNLSSFHCIFLLFFSLFSEPQVFAIRELDTAIHSYHYPQQTSYGQRSRESLAEAYVKNQALIRQLKTRIGPEGLDSETGDELFDPEDHDAVEEDFRTLKNLYKSKRKHRIKSFFSVFLSKAKRIELKEKQRRLDSAVAVKRKNIQSRTREIAVLQRQLAGAEAIGQKIWAGIRSQSRDSVDARDAVMRHLCQEGSFSEQHLEECLDVMGGERDEWNVDETASCPRPTGAARQAQGLTDAMDHIQEGRSQRAQHLTDQDKVSEVYDVCSRGPQGLDAQKTADFVQFCAHEIHKHLKNDPKLGDAFLKFLNDPRFHQDPFHQALKKSLEGLMNVCIAGPNETCKPPADQSQQTNTASPVVEIPTAPPLVQAPVSMVDPNSEFARVRSVAVEAHALRSIAGLSPQTAGEPSLGRRVVDEHSKVLQNDAQRSYDKILRQASSSKDPKFLIQLLKQNQGFHLRSEHLPIQANTLASLQAQIQGSHPERVELRNLLRREEVMSRLESSGSGRESADWLRHNTDIALMIEDARNEQDPSSREGRLHAISDRLPGRSLVPQAAEDLKRLIDSDQTPIATTLKAQVKAVTELKDPETALAVSNPNAIFGHLLQGVKSAKNVKGDVHPLTRAMILLLDEPTWVPTPEVVGEIRKLPQEKFKPLQAQLEAKLLVTQSLPLMRKLQKSSMESLFGKSSYATQVSGTVSQLVTQMDSTITHSDKISEKLKSFASLGVGKMSSPYSNFLEVKADVDSLAKNMAQLHSHGVLNTQESKNLAKHVEELQVACALPGAVRLLSWLPNDTHREAYKTVLKNAGLIDDHPVAPVDADNVLQQSTFIEYKQGLRALEGLIHNNDKAKKTIEQIRDKLLERYGAQSASEG